MTDSVSIKVNPLPEVNISLSTDSIGCSEFSIEAEIEDPLPTVIYDWIFGDGSDSGVGPVVQHNYSNDSTTFINYNLTVIAQSNFGCIDSASQIITIKPTSEAQIGPIDNIFCQIPGEVFVANETSSFSNNIRWFLDDVEVPRTDSGVVLNLNEEGTYILEMIAGNSFQCYDTIEPVTILVYDDFVLYVPNAFTPNGDGINDVHDVQGSNIKEYLIRIFDRWGNKMFESRDIGFDWDGTFKGKDVMTGTYVYYVKAISNSPCGSEEKFLKGSITVIR